MSSGYSWKIISESVSRGSMELVVGLGLDHHRVIIAHTSREKGKEVMSGERVLSIVSNAPLFFCLSPSHWQQSPDVLSTEAERGEMKHRQSLLRHRKEAEGEGSIIHLSSKVSSPSPRLSSSRDSCPFSCPCCCFHLTTRCTSTHRIPVSLSISRFLKLTIPS
jgi:hypothetical protein